MIETGETYDCVIVGGGISGLAAALQFQRLAGTGVDLISVGALTHSAPVLDLGLDIVEVR